MRYWFSHRARRESLMFVAASLAIPVCLFGVAAHTAAWREELEPSRFVCLMYHRFAATAEEAETDPEYVITAERFESHLKALKEAGYASLALADADEIINGARADSTRSVLITIDDGSNSVAEIAAPLLRRYGFTATIFVTADEHAEFFRTGPGQARLEDDTLRLLSERGFDIAAHGLSHVDLTALDDADLDRELVESRRRLSTLIGSEITAMSIPFNRRDARVIEHAREAGYRLIFNSDPGSNGVGDDAFDLRRINVAGNWSPDRLAHTIAPQKLARRRFIWDSVRTTMSWLPHSAPVAALIRTPLRMACDAPWAVTLLVLTMLATWSRTLRRMWLRRTWQRRYPNVDV